MSKKEVKLSKEDIVAKGLINVLALGYRGIELWRSKRKPLRKIEKSNEKKA